MSVHLSKTAAHKAASVQAMEAYTRGQKAGHSSGWSRIRFGVRRKLRFFWETYEK